MHIDDLFRKPEPVRTIKGSLFGDAPQEPQGAWVGETGKRSEFVLKLTARILLFEGYYVAIYKWEDKAGNDITWFASKDKDYTVGVTYRIRATVKRQTVYQGRKQTQISRLHTVCQEFEPYHPSESTENAWDAI